MTYFRAGDHWCSSIGLSGAVAQLSAKSPLSCNKVGRIQFVKSVKSHIQIGSTVSVNIIICSEFNEPLPAAIDKLDIHIHWILLSLPLCDMLNATGATATAATTNKDIQRGEVIAATVLSHSVRDDVCSLKLKAPDATGQYLLRINAVSAQCTLLDQKQNQNSMTATAGSDASSSTPSAFTLDAKDIFIVPVLSTEIEVVTDIRSVPTRQVISQLCNYRYITPSLFGHHLECSAYDESSIAKKNNPTAATSDMLLLVQEEYMKTLGSHLYDSAFILIKYILDNIDNVLLHESTAEAVGITTIRGEMTRGDSNRSFRGDCCCRRHCSSSTRVLELGAGIGLVGMFVSVLLTNKSVWGESRDDLGHEEAMSSSSSSPPPISSPPSSSSSSSSSASTTSSTTTAAIDSTAAVENPVEVYITDKLSQKALIEGNIAVNGLCDSCYFQEFDWENQRHVDIFRQATPSPLPSSSSSSTSSSSSSSSSSSPSTTLSSSSLKVHLGTAAPSSSDRSSKKNFDVILATDVLYDAATANLFFNVVKQVAAPLITRVLIAQKIRDPVNQPMGLVDVASQSGFSHIELLHREADVIIWSLYTSSSSSSGSSSDSRRSSNCTEECTNK